MELEGKIWKNRDLWVAEIPALGLLSQSLSKKATLDQIQAGLTELLKSHFPNQSRADEITIHSYPKGLIGITVTDSRLLLALSLRRQREQSGLTIREAAHRLGSRSPNAYAQYEKGKIRISLDKFEKLLHAANPYRKTFLRIR